MNNSKLQLHIERILEIPFEKYDKDFIFLVNNEEFHTSRIVADILSPIICQIHFTDATFDTFSIYTQHKGNFNYILNLLNFTSNNIPDSELPFISDILSILNNSSISIENNIDKTKLTIDNVFSLLKTHERYEVFYSKQIQTEIDFISSHFFEIESNQFSSFQSLSMPTLIRILQNENLQIKSEDQLLSIVNKLYSINNEYSVLYEFVNFLNVTPKGMQEFINVYDINDITQETWRLLSTRLESANESQAKRDDLDENMKENKKQHQQHQKKTITFVHEKEHEFNGIIRYLETQSPNNVENEIEVTSSSVNDLHFAKFAIYYETDEEFFASQNKSNSWICFEFVNHRVLLTNYTVKSACFAKSSYHPKSWALEGSNDLANWVIIDEQNNVKKLNGPKIMQTFNVKSNNNKEFKFLRLRQTSPNWGNNHHLILGGIEFYGNLI